MIIKVVDIKSLVFCGLCFDIVGLNWLVGYGRKVFVVRRVWVILI